MSEPRLPTARELFRVSPYSGPSSLVFRRLTEMVGDNADRQEGLLFRPWCELQPNGEIDVEELRNLLQGWSQLDARTPSLLFPIVPFLTPEDEYADAAMKKVPPPVMGRVEELPRGMRESAPPMRSPDGFGSWRSEIDREAQLVFPIAAGRDCRIYREARVSCSILGHGVRIAGRVSRSVVGDGTKIEPGVVIGDSIIGSMTLIGVGAGIRSNDQFEEDRGEIVIRDCRKGGRKNIRTGRTVLGAIIGDRCRVFAKLQPGTVLMPGCYVRDYMRLRAGIYSPELLDEMHNRHLARFDHVIDECNKVL